MSKEGKTLLVQIRDSLEGQEWNPDIWYKDKIGTVHHVKEVHQFNELKLSVIGSESNYTNQTYKIAPSDVDVLIPVNGIGFQEVPYHIFKAIREYVTE